MFRTSSVVAATDGALSDELTSALIRLQGRDDVQSVSVQQHGDEARVEATVLAPGAKQANRVLEQALRAAIESSDQKAEIVARRFPGMVKRVDQ